MTAKGTPRTDAIRAYQKKWREANREYLNAYNRAKYAKDPSKKNAYHKEKAYFLKKFYGITKEDRDRIIAEQGGNCPGCTEFLDLSLPRQVQVDHCHSTDKVRGVLCFGCNSAIGRVKDNIETLKRLIVYLEKHQ
jgi:hypothetical protein